MRYGFITIAVYLLTGTLKPVAAQQQIFKNYTVNDGLISNSIRRIFQDSKGFLWIATWEGLSKYDGYNFTNYSTANGLSHNLVNDFYESKDEKLYVALNDGSVDIISDNKITPRAVKTVAAVNRFLNTKNHPVVVATDAKGLQLFKNGKIVTPQHYIPDYAYLDLAWINDSLLVAASENAIRVMNNQFEFIAEARSINAGYVNPKVYQDLHKRTWFGTFNGLKMLSNTPQKNAALSFALLPASFNITALTQRRITAIMEDAQGTMWFGTTGGLVRINSDGTHQLITVKDGLASNIVTTIFQDNEMNIWFGTEVGISKLVTKSSIRLYPLENGVNASDNAYMFYPYGKSKILIGARNGLEIFDKSTGVFTPAMAPANSIMYSLLQNAAQPQIINSNTLTVFDTITSQCKKTKPLPVTGVSRMVADKYGNYFAGTLNHLFYCSGNSHQMILDYRISAIWLNKDGDLWAGTWQNGLYHLQYSFTNNQFHIIAQQHILPHENIRSLFEDFKKNIWAGTRYNGVYKISATTKDQYALTNFNQHTGLSSNFIKSIREDASGNFWIAFYQGLDKLIPEKNTYRIFNFSRINNYFTSVVGIEIDTDQSLWLATGEGITHITDGKLEKSSPLPVYITRVYSPDSAYPLQEKNLQLNYRQNHLQFEFSSPGFINEKQVLYSYRLSEDSNVPWTQGRNQHTVSYASLKPGNYLFEVRTIGWNAAFGKPASFRFTIHPPFWQTWWFITLCIAGIILMIYIIIKKRIQAIQHEAAMKQQIAETEMMALRAQMNPHFIFNCLNSIDNLIQMDEKDKATSYLSKFAKLIRSILENSKHNVVPCWKDVETLQLYLELEALRFDHTFSYNINISNEITNGDYKVPPLIIQPFVENAIHHGLLNKIDRDKKLVIDISVINNHILYCIEDNGVGRVKAASYKQLNKPSYESLGMQITSTRINLFNQYKNSAVKITDLYDESNSPIGTKVDVSLIIQP